MTTIDKIEIEISTDASKLQAGMTQASQSVSTFTDRVSKSAATLQGFGNIGMQAMGIMDRYEISVITVQNALMSVEDAQMRYNQALVNFGEGSEQATIAQNALTRATNQYDAAQMRANTSLAMMGLTMFGMIPQILKFGSTAVTTLKNVEVAAFLTSARLKALVPELIILSAIVGGAYYLWTQRTQETQSATERLTTSVDTSKLSVIQLRAEINKLTGEIEELGKPKRQPQSLMDQFLEYQATGIMPTKVTPEMTEIEKKTAEKEALITQLYTPENILGVVGATKGVGVSAEEYLGWGVPSGPTYGADRAGAERQNAELLADIKKIADEPKTMNVSININKIETYEDPGKVAQSIGEFIASGYSTAYIKPR